VCFELVHDMQASKLATQCKGKDAATLEI